MSVEANTDLKAALCTQQKLLQKLYNELEVERESSATAASEALAMILRLQGEKSALKMESEHYKRLSEEKMFHAEESMEIFEDIIHQKEMEIANLDYQVQAYRYKLSSLGLEEIGSNEIKYPENLLQLNENSVTETSTDNLLRRNSAPPKLLKMAYLKRGNLERNRSVSPDFDLISRKVEESVREDENSQDLDLEKSTDGIDSYWDQIRKLDKIVEEMAGEKYLSLRGKSSSVFSQINELDQSQSLKKSTDDCSLSVYDVFEVPEMNGKDNGKSILKYENSVEKEKVVNFAEDVMKMKLTEKDLNFFVPRDDIVVGCHMAVAQGSSVQMNTTTEITEEVSSREVLRLLHEINEKLDSLKLEIKSGKLESKKPSPDLDVPMFQLKEAMLHFWL